MKFKLKAYSKIANVPGFEWAIGVIRDFLSLLTYSRRGTYSQHGEDLFLVDYFKGRTGVYMDIGASHPFRISNTYLLYCRGWSGVTVEPIEHLSKKHKRWRPRDQQCCEAVGSCEGLLTFYEMVPSVLSTFDYESVKETIEKGGILRRERTVSVTTIKSLKQRFFPNKEVDLLTVDAEGLDFAILSSNDWSEFRPKIVIFEANERGDEKADNLLTSNQYRLLKVVGCNKVYERV